MHYICIKKQQDIREMKTIEQIITSEILHKYNTCAFDSSDFSFEFDYEDDIVTEVTGRIDVQGYRDYRGYYDDINEYVITSVEVNISKVEFFNEDGLMPVKVDLSKIDRLVEMYIR